MAINLPTTDPGLDPATFNYQREILSGDAADDHLLGLRVLPSAQNHAWAYRTQTLISQWSPTNAILFKLNDSSYTDLTHNIKVDLSAGVTNIEIHAWFRYGKMKLHVHDTSSAIEVELVNTSSTVLEKSGSLTVGVTTGAVATISVSARKVTTALECYGFSVHEKVVASGDIT